KDDRRRLLRLRQQLDAHAVRKIRDDLAVLGALEEDLGAERVELRPVLGVILDGEADVVRSRLARRRARLPFREQNVDAGEHERVEPPARALLAAELTPDFRMLRDVRHTQVNMPGADAGVVRTRELRFRSGPG